MGFQPVDYDPFAPENLGDPEAAGLAAASTAMQPAVTAHIAGVGNDLLQWGQQQQDTANRLSGASLATRALDPASLETATNIALSTGPGAIRAFHGSPHDFDAFSLGKIGTGEGAQSEGHGLYFADQPAIGADYRERLAGSPDIRHWSVGSIPLFRNSQPIDYSPRTFDKASIAKATLQEEMLLHEWDYRGIAHDPQQMKDFTANLIRRFTQDDGYPQESLNYYNRVLRQVENGTMPINMRFGPQPGKLYEVDLHTTPEALLHYDKPLSEQTPQVQQILRQFVPEEHPMTPHDLLGKFLDSPYAKNFPDVGDVRTARRIFEEPYYPEEITEWAAKQNSPKSSAYNLIGPVGSSPYTTTGGQLYNQLAYGTNGLGEAGASQALRDAGIPGVRYFDNVSRNQSFDIYPSDNGYSVYHKPTRELTTHPTEQAANQHADSLRSHNYVIYDDKIIDIIKKYGLAALISGGAMTLGGNADAKTHLIPVPHDPFGE